MRALPILLFAVTTSALTGCEQTPQADYSKVDLLNVGGTVTMDGAPLVNAVVTFESPETGSFSYALTDLEGHYQLQFDSEMAGVTPGEKIVRISTAKKILGLNSNEEGGGDNAAEFAEEGDEREAVASARAAELVPARYHRDSDRRVTVSASNTNFDFALTSTDQPASNDGEA